MKTLLKEAQKTICEMEEKLKEINEFQKHAPDGCLKIQNRNGSICFYQQYWDEQNQKWNRKYINRENISLARALAQKHYYLRINPVLEQNLCALRLFDKKYCPKTIETVYEELSEERKKIITPIKGSKEDKIKLWKEENYEKNDFFSENLKYETEQGELVRSKSEVIIANTLFQHQKDILYKYERPLRVTEGGMPKTIYPDFTILILQTGRIVYWEHAGRMDDPDYADDFVKKVNTYLHNNLFPGVDVFFTYESMNVPLETGIIRKLINKLTETE